MAGDRDEVEDQMGDNTGEPDSVGGEDEEDTMSEGDNNLRWLSRRRLATTHVKGFVQSGCVFTGRSMCEYPALASIAVGLVLLPANTPRIGPTSTGSCNH